MEKWEKDLAKQFQAIEKAVMDVADREHTKIKKAFEKKQQQSSSFVFGRVKPPRENGIAPVTTLNGYWSRPIKKSEGTFFGAVLKNRKGSDGESI
jgi:hypothetical protein